MSGAAAMLMFPACNGIFGNIYDIPQSDDAREYGFVAFDDRTNIGRIYIDATDYKEWHYIDLHNRQVVTVPVDGPAPADWDFAVHRYDTKTCDGAVAETAASDFHSLPDIASIPGDAFIADEWTAGKITLDMSQMMDGIILYAEDWYNPCLSGWLDVDTSMMPPIYTLSDKIYLLRLPDDTYAALRLTNFMNDTATKGFMTIDYSYPVRQ